MTLEAAKRRALTLRGCMGFCYRGDPPVPGQKVFCSFVGNSSGKADTFMVVPATNGRWTSYQKTKDCQSWNNAVAHAELGQRDPDRRVQGSPGATLFGCLPLEETVVLYTLVDVVVSAVSLVCLLLLNRSFGSLLGLRTVQEMRTVEIVVSCISLVLGIAAIAGMWSHRSARYRIKEIARDANVGWDRELDEAFGAVLASDRDEGQKLLIMLKKGSRMTGWLMVWQGMKLFINIPIFGMVLV